MLVAGIEKVDPAAMETMNRLPSYIQHLLLQEPKLALRIPSYCLEAVARILAKVKTTDPEREAFIAGAEAALREEIGQSSGLAAPTLEALAALSQPPLLDSFGRTERAIFLDVFAATVNWPPNAMFMTTSGIKSGSSRDMLRWAASMTDCAAPGLSTR